MNILFAVTVPSTARSFLDGHLQKFVSRGHIVSVACANDGLIGGWFNQIGVAYFPTEQTRSVNALGDLKALTSAIRIVSKLRPDCVVAGTPKAALVFLIAAWVSRVPNRIYVVHGLRYEGFSGVRRLLMRNLEWIMLMLSTRTLCVSQSVESKVRALAFASAKTTVLGAGSANGVDTSKFVPIEGHRRAVEKAELSVPAGSIVVSFVGRVCSDKGGLLLGPLAEALSFLGIDFVLLVTGEWEENALMKAARNRLSDHPKVRVLGNQQCVEKVIGVSDVVVLPTLREGLPTVLIEAGACGVPVVATRVTGCIDVIEVPLVGELIDDRDDIAAWVCSISRLVDKDRQDPSLGRRRRDITIGKFERGAVVDRWVRFIEASQSV